MNANENSRIPKDHENLYILPLKPPEITLDIAVEHNEEVPSNETREIKVPTDISPKQTLGETDAPSRKSEEQDVDEIGKNDNKGHENNMFITMRIYDTYLGQQSPPQQPHLQQPFQRQPIHQQYQNQWGGGGGYYAEEPLAYDPQTRNSFVKFVFTILLMMILVTSAFILIVITTDSLKNTFRRHSLIFLIVGVCLLLVCHYAIYCSPCARVPPCNICVLILAVIAYCILAGNLSARYKTELILYAALATAGVVFICLLVACSKFDFTSWFLYAIVISAVFCMIALIVLVASLIVGHYPKPLHIAILVIGTLIQVVMLIIELQMILGGKSVELNENDYALGAYMLYTSIMSLFMNLLQLIGLTN